jgi:hypothetical protein
MESFETKESMEKLMDERLESAKEHALPYDAVTEIINKINDLREKSGDHEEEISDLKQKIKPSTVTVHTISEFKLLLQKTDIDPDETIQLLAHENAHANKADSVGAKEISYNLLIADGGECWRYDAWVSYDIPDSWPERERIISKISILNAPKEYGDDHSDEDQAMIRKLKAKL